MQRIVVMGPPGSGKSTLARQLGARFGLPVFHLDQAYWRPGWAETPADCFRVEVERLAVFPTWVIDGNYTSTIGPRFAVANTVIYLDVPSWLSMLRCFGARLSATAAFGQALPPVVPSGSTRPFCASPGLGTVYSDYKSLH